MVIVNRNNFKDFKTAEIETGMYLSFCISNDERELLASRWNENGGYKVTPWYKWVLQNVSVSVDLK